MRKLVFRLHLIVALVAGAFIAMLGITGSIIAFEPGIDHLLHHRIAYVKPQGAPLTLVQIGQAVRQSSPNRRVSGYLLPNVPNMSYRAMVGRQLVYVNQYSGQVLGTVTGGMDFLAFVHQLHLRLALLDRGRRFGETTVRWSAVAALFLLLTGAYLWWPTKRVGVAGAFGSLRLWFDLHNSFGILSLVFWLILVLTGLIMAFEAQTTPLLYRITDSQPPSWPRMQTIPMPGKTPITPDQALAIARRAVPGAEPTFINVPQGKQVFQIFSRYPEDRTPGGRTRIAVDPYGGNVLMLVDSRHAPAGYRLVNLNRALHTGDIFGLPSNAVMSLASLLLVFQLLTGLVMWIKRQTVKKRAVGVAKGSVLKA